MRAPTSALPRAFRTGLGVLPWLAAGLGLACGGGAHTDPPLSTGPSGSISLALSESAGDLYLGSTLSVTVSLARDGYSGGAYLYLESPAGITGTFAPGYLAPGAVGSTLVISSPTADPGAYNITVRARGTGVHDAAASFQLTVIKPGTFTIALDPATLTLGQGGTVSTRVWIDRTNLTDDVALSLEGLAPGITGLFLVNPLPVSLTSLWLFAAPDAETGTRLLTVRGTVSFLPDRTAALTLTVTPPPTGFTLGLSPSSVTVARGQQAVVTIGIVRTNFSGAVDLVPGSPSTITLSVNPPSTTGDTATLTIDVGATAAPGVYYVGVTGSGAGVPDSTALLVLTVT